MCEIDESDKFKITTEDFIKKHFDREKTEMCGLNNVKVYCGIITKDQHKATEKIKEIYNTLNKDYIEKYIDSANHKEIRLINGRRYTWVKPTMNSRGYRFGKIILDKDLTITELQEIVFPICYSCGRDDVEIF